MVLTLAPIAWCQVSWECSSGNMVRPLNGSDRTLLFSDEDYNRTFELESSMYGIYYLRWASTVSTVARAVTSVWERHQSLERLNYLSHLHITHTRNSTLDNSTSFCAFTVNEWLLYMDGMSLSLSAFYQCFHHFPSDFPIASQGRLCLHLFPQ